MENLKYKPQSMPLCMCPDFLRKFVSETDYENTDICKLFVKNAYILLFIPINKPIPGYGL